MLRQTDSLGGLPADAFKHLFTFLGPHDTRIASANKQFHSFFKDPTSLAYRAFWIGAFKRHFPKRLENILFHQKIGEINWKAKFKKAESEEYKGLSPTLKKLFYLVKEGDSAAVLASDISFDDLNSMDSNYESLLTWAYISKNQKILDHFYSIAQKFYCPDEKNIDVNKCDNADRTLLHWAVSCAQPADHITALIQQGYDVNRATLKQKMTLLHLAAKYGHTSGVKALLDANANTNLLNDLGRTPLFIAAISPYGNADCVKALLTKPPVMANANGVNINTIMLDIASMRGYTDRVEALLTANAGAFLDNNAPHCPLYRAANNGHIGCVRALIYAGVKVDKATPYGTTPLSVAASGGYIDCVEALLAAKANVNLSNKDGVTPLFAAAENGHTGCVRALLQAGAKVNQRMVLICTPIRPFQSHLN